MSETGGNGKEPEKLIFLLDVPLTLYNHTTAVTAVPAGAAVLHRNFFKISSLCVVDLKTFRAASSSKFLFGNGKVTVYAAKPVFFLRYQCQYFVFAGSHNFSGESV